LQLPEQQQRSGTASFLLLRQDAPVPLQWPMALLLSLKRREAVVFQGLGVIQHTPSSPGALRCLGWRRCSFPRPGFGRIATARGLGVRAPLRLGRGQARFQLLPHGRGGSQLCPPFNQVVPLTHRVRASRPRYAVAALWSVVRLPGPLHGRAGGLDRARVANGARPRCSAPAAADARRDDWRWHFAGAPPPDTRRAQLAGLAGDFGAHSLRSGFVTEAGRQNVASVRRWILRGTGACRRFWSIFGRALCAPVRPRIS
jgi:hypothetical protein